MHQNGTLIKDGSVMKINLYGKDNRHYNVSTISVHKMKLNFKFRRYTFNALC